MLVGEVAVVVVVSVVSVVLAVVVVLAAAGDWLPGGARLISGGVKITT